MAADSVGWAYDYVKTPVAAKIKRMPDGGLFAAAGSTSEIMRFTAWMLVGGECPSDFDKDNGFTALWAKPDGSLWLCTHKLYFYELTSQFFAIGVPSIFLMGALHAGASAEQAVRLAIDHTDGAGGTVQVERLAQ